MSSLAEKVAALPEQPGVYLFKDADGEVLYVGKAQSLRDRVRSYLRPGGDGRVFIPFLGERAKDVDFLVTASEHEAFLLEDTLIKKFKPRFNIRLRDDKAFLLLRLDRSEPWPWFRLVRRRKADGAEYFGPYSSALSIRRTLRLLFKLVPLRDCKDTVFHNRVRPCLKHQIGRCPAPCVGRIAVDAYAASLDRACQILRGDTREIVQELKDQMAQCAERMEFERAQALRDSLEALGRVGERQQVRGEEAMDRDVLGLWRFGTDVTVVVLEFRGGKLLSSRRFRLHSELPDAEVLATLLTQMYGTDRYVPREILVPLEPHDRAPLEAWLRTRRGAVVEILVPQIGAKRKLVDMALLNAREQDRVAADQEGRDQESLVRLQELLGLEDLPEHIHCLDISTIQGRSTVASRVAFRGGRPEKAGYRKFRIRSITGQDDFAAMAEALERSLALCLEKDEDLPDLVVIDGGKGQLGSAREVLGNLGLLDEVAIVGLAKDRTKVRGAGSSAVREQTGERVFMPGRELPIPLRPGEPETHLLTHVRNEAHRFAITYHRKLRGRIGSQLDQIPGVGPARRKALLRRFAGITGVMKASVAEIAAVEGIPPELAHRIWSAFHQNDAVE